MTLAVHQSGFNHRTQQIKLANKKLSQTAKAVVFFAKETQKNTPARRWLSWR
jgi:hypothetical protein